ncbi:WGR domain-containing protein [Myxococcus stipitatus DSM 14675]|uniref:WGR domain-containing protein n=1 Tax=Myxococcus stipitatus (strain DSM 14675 / JCM 12634 / Mx s8) TaxID=1278073 RepID=L7UAQ5_MYXSD|nr:WGR domain-containing protein [Myxococcus stipitatus]AGC45986.1 WGR domain-containing protein [Myxococcus stipitatus DSM 14675]
MNDEREERRRVELGLRPGEAVFVDGRVDQVAMDADRLVGLVSRLMREEPISELRIQVDLAGSEESLHQVLVELREVGLASSLRSIVIDRRKYWEVIRDDELDIHREAGDVVRLELLLIDFERPDSGVDLLELALTSLDTSRLEAVDIALTQRGPTDATRLVEVLHRGGPLPSVRELTVGYFTGIERDWIQWVRLDALETLLSLYPGLQTLVLPMAELQVGRLEHPELRSLSLNWLGATPLGPSDLSAWKTSPVPKASGLQFLREACLPKLEQLGIDFQFEWYVGWTPEDVHALFQAEGLVRLRHLVLRYCGFGDVLCEALIHARFAPQLEVIDLTGTELSDVGSRILARAPSLSRVKQLICARREISPDAWNELAARYLVTEPP